MASCSFYIRIVVRWVHFLFDSLALLNQERKVKFITSTIARYSLQQNVTNVTQSVCACSKSTIETQDQGLKSVQSYQ